MSECGPSATPGLKRRPPTRRVVIAGRSGGAVLIIHGGTDTPAAENKDVPVASHFSSLIEGSKPFCLVDHDKLGDPPTKQPGEVAGPRGGAASSLRLPFALYRLLPVW